MESIYFFNEKGQRLSGNLYYPKNTNKRKKHPAVILIQGLSGSKEKVLPDAAKIFTKNGYIALAFDYRGHGESEGEKNRFFPLERIEDSRHAIAWARQQKEIDENKIYLYGLSYGGATVLCVSALEKNIKAASSVSGATLDGFSFMRGLRANDDWITLKNKLEIARNKRSLTGEETLLEFTKDVMTFGKSFGDKYSSLGNKNKSSSIPTTQDKSSNTLMLTAKSVEAMIEFDISNYIEKLIIPTCVIHGEKDQLIDIEEAMNTFAKIKSNKELYILKDKDHIDLDSGDGLKKQVQLSIEWFKKHP